MLSRHFLVRSFQSSAYLQMPKKKNKQAVSTNSVCTSVKEEEGPVCVCKTGIKIQILAKPGAKTNTVTDIGTEVGIQIAAPPVDGEANTELVKYLSKVLELKKSQINLDKGSRSRNKTVIVLEGKRTTVELRDEREVTGKIIKVDGYMNITMKRVKWKSLTSERLFDDFYVSGKMIRYVHIPDEIDMKQAMEEKLTALCPHKANMRVQQEIKDQAWRKMQKKHQSAKKQLAKQ